MYTEVTFSMDARTSAPHRVGSMLVPQAAQYRPRWIDRDGRSYVTIEVHESVVDDMIRKVSRMHPTVRCIAREAVVTTE